MKEQKAVLRNKLRLQRKTLNKEDKKVYDKNINSYLMGLDVWDSARAVHIYEPIEFLKEISTNTLKEFLVSKGVVLYTFQKLEENWYVLPMSKELNNNPFQFDVVLVPMLGFDASKNRLGRGGGSYDRFLSSQTNAVKIGVSYSSNYVDKLPVEPHDISMDIVVTEARIYL